MRCSYCGKELPTGAGFCNGCGARFDNQQMMPNQNGMPNYNNQNMGYYNQNNQMYQNYGNYNNYQQPKKNNNLKFIIIIIVLVVILVATIIFGGWFLFKNNENNDVKDDQEVVDKEDSEDSEDSEDNKIIYTNNFILTIPKGYVINQQSLDESLITSKDCTMYLKEYSYTTTDMIALKDEFISQMEQVGYKITSFDEETILNRKTVAMKTNLNGIECVLLFVDIDDKTSLYFVIASLDGSQVNKSLYEDAVTIANSAKRK